MSIDLSTVSLPFDRWGTAATNKIPGERQTLTSVAWTEFNILIPKYAPFYAESIADDGLVHLYSGRRLIRGKDWIEGWYFQSASGEIGLDINSCIYFYDPTMAGEVQIDSYQAMGGEWQINGQKLTEILAHKLLNPLRYFWEQVAELPEIFNPLDHDQDIQDFTKLGDLLDNLTGIAKAIQTASGDTGGQFTAHLSDTNNPHKTNKAHIGLPLVQNYAVATATDVSLSVLNPSTYLNPPTAKILIDALVKIAMDNLLATPNPTGLTPEVLGVYTKEETDSFFPILANGQMYDLQAKTVGGKTADQIISAAKAEVNAQLQTISDGIRGAVEDVIANSTDINASTFDHKTPAEWEQMIAAAVDSGSGSVIGDLKDLISLAGWTTVPSMEKLINQQIKDAVKDAQGNPIIPNPLNVTDDVMVWFASFVGFDTEPKPGFPEQLNFVAKQAAVSVEYLVADNGNLPISVRCAYEPSFTKGTVTYVTNVANPVNIIEPQVRLDPFDSTRVQFGFKYKGGSMPDVSCQAQAGGDGLSLIAKPLVYMTTAANAPFPVPVTATYVETVVTLATVKSVTDLGQALTQLTQSVSTKNQAVDVTLLDHESRIKTLQQNPAKSTLKVFTVVDLVAGATETFSFSSIVSKDLYDLDACRKYVQVFDSRTAAVAPSTGQKWVNSEAVCTVAQDDNGIYVINQSTDAIKVRYHFEFDKK